MIYRRGFRSFEFRLGSEKSKGDDTLKFTSSEEALKWLNDLQFLYSNLSFELKDYVLRYGEDPGTFRLTDHYVLERLADLLYLRRIVVVLKEERTVFAASGGVVEHIAPAFPLSERKPQLTTDSYQPPVSQAPTFDPHLDGAAQAAALVAAAADGRPFCPE
jgi:hypothetical protein